MLRHHIFYPVVVLAEVLLLELDHLVVLPLQRVKLPDQLVQLHHRLAVLLCERLQQLPKLLISRLRAIHCKHDINPSEALAVYCSLTEVQLLLVIQEKVTSYYSQKYLEI